MRDKYEILYRYFGYSSFRGGQAELIDAKLSGRDVGKYKAQRYGKTFLAAIRKYLSD